MANSWQTYVDNQICSFIQCKFAVIAGAADGGIWAKYEREPSNAVSQQELKGIIDTMKSNPAKFHESGVMVGGEKYICLNAEDKLLRGRKGASPLCVVLTNSCLLVAATIDGVSAGQLNTVIEKLGDYLRQSGY